MEKYYVIAHCRYAPSMRIDWTLYRENASEEMAIKRAMEIASEGNECTEVVKIVGQFISKQDPEWDAKLEAEGFTIVDDRSVQESEKWKI